MADKKTFKKTESKKLSTKQMQIGIIAGLIVLILIIAVVALLGHGKNPVKSEELYGDSYVAYSGSFEVFVDEDYVDEYTLRMSEYSDVIIPENNLKDDDYIKETLFVGDSNTEALSNFNYVSIQHVLGYSGMGIQSVTSSRCMWFVGYDEPVTMVQAVSMMKPRRIIINFGTNNAGGYSVEDFVYTYKKAINAILKAYPYTDIIVESIFPVGKVSNYPNIKMHDIDEMNLGLAEMCRENGYKFLNTSESLKGEDGFINTDYISSDGIHLSSAGYTKVLEYVTSHKFITADQRPSKGNVPTRRTAPVIASSSSEVISSSSIMSSSSIVSSEVVSSISQVSSDTNSNTANSNSTVESIVTPEETPVPSTAPDPTVAPTPEQTPEPEPEQHVHSYSESVVNATCTSDGSVTKTCSCGDTQVTTIPKTAHSFGDGPTCAVCGASNPNYTPPAPPEAAEENP